MSWRSEKEKKNFSLAPLRPLDDFLLESARFQIPNVNDLEKWGNRVVCNLLYYQTNYFLMSLLIFIIVGLLHPLQMICGIIVTGVAANFFKKQYPFISLAAILVIAGSFMTYIVGSVLVFALGIFLPFSITFVHASLRMRNLKNKLQNTVENLGLSQTPMGFFLVQLGMEPDTFWAKT